MIIILKILKIWKNKSLSVTTKLMKVDKSFGLASGDIWLRSLDTEEAKREKHSSI